MRKLIFTIIAAAIIVIAAVFTLYGIVQMSEFTHYSGEDFNYFNDGFGAFVIGSFALVISGILRFPLRQWIISGVAVIGLAVLGLQRFKVPAQVPGELVFPDAGMLNLFIVFCMVLLLLGLGDGYVRRIVDAIVVNPLRGIFYNGH